ncbi:MAG TPA: Rieske 2Fe-2S domain-containing protein [Conexibacter sp.]|nr:Rieske 2Fe-2S domain-containing protein [Conexibacter sp.]
MSAPGQRATPSLGTTVKAWLLLRLLRRAAPHRPDGQAAAGPARDRELPSTPRAEALVALLLLAAALCAGGFIVFYVVLDDTQLLGLCLGLALVLLGIAAATAGKRIVPQEQHAEPYHAFGDEQAVEEVTALVKEGDDGVSRRGLLTGAAAAAGATLGAAALVPLASLGPHIADRVASTPWHRGRRVVDSDGRVLRPQDVAPGELVLAFPEDAPRDALGSAINVLRFAPEQLRMSPARRAAAPGGVVAYSRICPHAACAVSLYRTPLYAPTAPSPALVCPCHYSTFDPRRAGAVLFGPAGRPLPQLPLEVNAAGELAAAGNFLDAIGPSYGSIRQLRRES